MIRSVASGLVHSFGYVVYHVGSIDVILVDTGECGSRTAIVMPMSL